MAKTMMTFRQFHFCKPAQGIHGIQAYQQTTHRNFSSAPPAKAVDVTHESFVEQIKDQQEVKTFGGYTFSEDQIKGNTRGQDGLLLMAYTCGKCEHKQARTFSRHSYEKGVVLIRCENCDSLHLVADNLGWFEDGKVNIEEIMKRKGEHVQTNVTDQSVEFSDDSVVQP